MGNLPIRKISISLIFQASRTSKQVGRSECLNFVKSGSWGLFWSGRRYVPFACSRRTEAARYVSRDGPCLAAGISTVLFRKYVCAPLVTPVTCHSLAFKPRHSRAARARSGLHVFTHAARLARVIPYHSGTRADKSSYRVDRLELRPIRF